jgi:hypothetical protein
VKSLAVLQDSDKDAITESSTPFHSQPVIRNALHLTMIVESLTTRVQESDLT